MNKKGFTLIEILAVIVVLALILAIAVPVITGIITETKKKAMVADAKLIVKAVNLKKLEDNTFMPTIINHTNIESNLRINDENYNVLAIKIKNDKPYITIEGKNKWEGLTVYGYFDDMQVINSDEYDVVPPTLSIIGLSELTIEQGGTYFELGVLAEDNQDTNIQSKAVITGTVDTSKLGTYTIKYNAEDLTGNTAVEKVRTINIVSPANPEIAFNPNTNTTYEKTQSTTVSVTDNVAVNTASLKYLWSTSTSGIVEGDFSSSFTNNTEVSTPANLTGNYYLWILAKDLSGNTTISRSNVFKLDNTAPTSATASLGIITSNSIIVNASGSDNETLITEYQFSKDNGTTWTTKGTSSTYQFNDLTSGTYQIKVKLYNETGYSLESDAINAATSTIPTPTYTISESGWSTSKTVTIEYGTTEYTKQYSIDGGTMWNTTTGQTQTVLFNENGSVIARITDGINTVSASTYNVTQIDTEAPTIAFGTNGSPTYAKTHSSVVTVSDNGAIDTTNLKYLWSTSASGITESNITTSFTNGGTITNNTATGSYYLWILAKDQAGNTTISKTNGFNLDNTPPIISVVGTNPVYLPTGTFYYEDGATATDTISGSLTVSKSGTVTTSTNGTYTITYSATDGSGNTASATRTVNVINGTFTYAYTGGQQTFTVPATGKYKMEAWGAQGGGGGGAGGYAAGIIQLTSGTTFYIHVGGTTSGSAGGYNGGGSVTGSVYGGGGATDIRTTSGVWNDTTSLRSRILVAGAGGGNGNGYAGGAGGGLNGNNGAGENPGYGASQTTGGAAANYGSVAGGFGYGGGGSWGNEPLGAGGSGYYGGSGAGGQNSNGAGGGGSSFVSGLSGANAINSSGVHTGQANHFSGYVFTGASTITGANTGNGSVKISLMTEYSFDFAYVGGYQTFTAPKTGTYKMELWGSQGGGNGGKGAYTSGNIYLTQGTTLYVYIGSTTGGSAGGYNGGGSVYNNVYGGGGASDIRTTAGVWNDATSLRSRIMVAGAGGGNGNGYGGGAAGALTGFNGSGDNPGYGGGQTAGGASANYGSVAGGFGTGGGGDWNGGEPLGAGGSGYYGGSGAGGQNNNGSGAGGSSFVSGYSGCNAINSSGVHTGQPNHFSGYVFSSGVMTAGNASMPSILGGTETGHAGNGYGRITLIGQ